MTRLPARRLWEVVEPIHACVYFHPDAAAAYRRIGLKGFWMGYFASRAAAFGPVGPNAVIAAFYGFAPPMVQRAVPDCWNRASPSAVLSVRHHLAVDALAGPIARRGIEMGEVAALSTELVGAAARLPYGGRPLAAAQADQPVPDDPVLRLWWACTVLREHRGDGHVAALLASGISPVEAHVLKVAAGEATEEALRPHRGWTAGEWASARLGLAARGLLDEDGRLTGDGSVLRSVVEHVTDTAAEPGWWALGGGEASDGMIRRLAVVAAAVLEAGAVPFPNGMGLPWTVA